jgi:hypothetical protein
MSKTMANPEWVDEVNLFRAKAGEPYQNFDGGGFHRNQLSPLPKIGEGFREWSEASSYGKKRLVMLRPCRGIPALQPSLIKGLKISAPENEQPEYVGASPCIKKDKNFKKRSRFVGLCKKSAIFAVIITIVD